MYADKDASEAEIVNNLKVGPGIGASTNMQKARKDEQVLMSLASTVYASSSGALHMRRELG
jgi:hypothetical protein